MLKIQELFSPDVHFLNTKYTVIPEGITKPPKASKISSICALSNTSFCRHFLTQFRQLLPVLKYYSANVMCDDIHMLPL